MNGFLDAFGTFAHGDDPILVFTLVCSVLIVALAMERAFAVIRVRGVVRRAAAGVLVAARDGDLARARSACDDLGSPVREVFSDALDRALRHTRGQPRSAMQRAQKRVAARLRAMLWVLGTSGALMPFVGLLGTVLGVMNSFKAIGETGAGGFQVVSTGISAALVATAAGLFVALEAVVFFNILQNMAAAVLRELSLAADETLEMIETAEAPAVSPEAGHAGSSAGS